MARYDNLSTAVANQILPHTLIFDGMAVQPKELAATLRDAPLTLMAVERWGQTSLSGQYTTVLETIQRSCWQSGLQFPAIHFRVTLSGNTPLLPHRIRQRIQSNVAFIWIQGETILPESIFVDHMDTDTLREMLMRQAFALPKLRPNHVTISEFVLHYTTALVRAPAEKANGGWDRVEGGVSKCKFDRRVATMVSATEFRSRYAGSRPVVFVRKQGKDYGRIRGALSATSLSKNYRQYDVESGDPGHLSTGVHGQMQTVGNFIARANKPSNGVDRNYSYVVFDVGTFLSKAKQLTKVLRPIQYLAGDVADGRMDIFEMAADGTTISWKSGGAAWLELYYGMKLWTLYDNRWTHIPGGARKDWTHSEWLRHIMPALPYSCRPAVCSQRPGDILYIPDGWWHAVSNVGMSISVGAQAVTVNSAIDVVRARQKSASLAKQLNDSVSSIRFGNKVPVAEKAVSVAKAHLETWPATPDLQYAVGSFLLATGKVGAAEAYLRTAAGLDPTRWQWRGALEHSSLRESSLLIQYSYIGKLCEALKQMNRHAELVDELQTCLALGAREVVGGDGAVVRLAKHMERHGFVRGNSESSDARTPKHEPPTSTTFMDIVAAIKSELHLQSSLTPKDAMYQAAGLLGIEITQGVALRQLAKVLALELQLGFTDNSLLKTEL
jgi:hypothetical protein